MFKRCLITVVLCLNLSGCIGAAVVAGGAAASVILSDERPLTTIAADQTIEHLAAKALSQNETLKQTNISLTSLNRRVLLTGQVSSTSQRVLAYRLVKSVPKVIQVYNQIVVTPQPSVLSTSQDAWLTSKVRFGLLNTHALHSNQIRITTENGVVYLMGILTPTQQKLATNTVRKISGVRKVVTLFETIH